MTRELFQRVFMNRLHAHYPRVHVVDELDLEVTLLVGGERIRLELAELQRRAVADPAHQESMIDLMLGTVMAAHTTRDRGFNELRRQMLPLLKHPDFVAESTRLVPEKGLVFRPFLAGLQIAYVVDEPSALRYINAEDLDHWGISLDELDAIARANLAVRTVTTRPISVGEGALRLFIFNTMDSYDATRVLLPDQLRRMAAQVSGRLVVGIPNRDFLIAFGDANAQLLDRVRWQVKRDNHATGTRLTDRLLTWQDDAVVEYC